MQLDEYAWSYNFENTTSSAAFLQWINITLNGFYTIYPETLHIMISNWITALSLLRHDKKCVHVRFFLQQ